MRRVGVPGRACSWRFSGPAQAGHVRAEAALLYLVRHAHSPYEPDDRRGLSAEGRRAAGQVADVLAERDVTRIVSSPARRAVETVEPLATRLGLPIELEEDLRERHLSAERLADFDHCVERTWQDFDFALPGGESNAAAQARIARVVDGLGDPGEASGVVVATHGNALALYLRTRDPCVGFAFWSRLSMPDVYAVDPQAGFAWRRVWSDAG